MVSRSSAQVLRDAKIRTRPCRAKILCWTSFHKLRTRSSVPQLASEILFPSQGSEYVAFDFTTLTSTSTTCSAVTTSTPQASTSGTEALANSNAAQNVPVTIQVVRNFALASPNLVSAVNQFTVSAFLIR